MDRAPASPDPSEPPLRPFGRAEVPAPTGDEAAAYDRWAIEQVGVPQTTLMENAGRNAAAILQALFPNGPVVGVVGSGNNGGDALVLLRTLAAWGRDVRGIRVADRADDRGLLHGWSVDLRDDHGLDSDSGFERELRGAAVLVDGILGTGIRGAPRERQARAIAALNRAEAPIFALDIPSGVDAGTGATPGESIRAAVTVAFGWPKLGSLLPPGRERSGRLIAVEIGFPPGLRGSADRADDGVDTAPAMACAVTTPEWAALHRPRRREQAHKYSVGSLLLHAGREGMAGAAVMSGRSALRGGVGLLRIASDPANRVILQEALPEAIFVDATDPEAMADAVEASAAVASGPGIGVGRTGAAALRSLLEARDGRPLVLDADALTLLGAASGIAAEEELPELASLGRDGPTLVTPHPGEMARISSRSKEEIAEDPVGAARDLARESGCAVLLKGLPSIVACAPPSAPDRAGEVGRVRIDSQASSDLAVGGMGDVLTGLCGAFLAQGVERACMAGSLGLHFSGRAAALAALGASLTPSDVIVELPRALSEEGPGMTELDLPFILFDRDPPR